MEYGISIYSVLPLRKIPDHRSEMVSQLLFGEHFEVLEKKGDWFYIRNGWDGYEGWLFKRMFATIDETTYKAISNTPKKQFCCSVTAMVTHIESGDCWPVLMGSSLPLLNRGKMKWGSHTFRFDGEVFKPGNEIRESIVGLARQYLNVPYLWGGRSPFGVDCSGLVQLLMRMNGIQVRRDAWQQAESGENVGFPEEALPGDVAFFDSPDGKIIHTGIIAGDGKIIHASALVRCDKMDHQGIFAESEGKYTHKLRIIKRYLP